MLATVNWIGGSGDWDTVANWSDGATNRLPGVGDDAVIDVAAAVTVTHASGAHTVQSLTINEAFTLSGGALSVTGNLVNANAFTMTAGILRSAKVAGQGSAVLVAAGGTLDGVTLGATVGGVPTSATVRSSNNFNVTGGLTFANGSLVDLGNQLFVTGDQTVGGVGEIRFREAYSAIYPSGNLVFGAGLAIHRSDAGFSDITVNNGGSITNRGTIRADAGGQIRVFSNLGSATFTNALGGVLATDGGTLSLATDWTNAGQIAVNNSTLNPNSTLNLGGSFTTAGIGSITRTGGSINLTGLLDNTGSTLALDATSGSWNLGVGGRLRRGSLVTSGGAVLEATAGTLDGLTLGAAVGGVPRSATVQGNSGGAGGFTVTGGLTFANGSLVDLGTGMILDGDQTLGGNGEIRFRGNSGIANYYQTTFGPGLTIHRADANSSDITIVGGSITNQGTLRADAGGQIRVTGNTTLINAVGGVLSADGGGTLSLLSPTWSNAGQIIVNNSTLNLGGSFTTAGLGAYTRTGGAINLVGLLDNTGKTFALDAVTGSWNLASGGAELRGGNLVTSGGAALVATGSGTLKGVTLGGLVSGVPASATVRGTGGGGFLVTGGLTFTNGSLMDLDYGLTLESEQTLGGDGEIRFRGTSPGIRSFNRTTFGPGLTIRSEASNASFFAVGGSITNQGTIQVDAGQLVVGGNAAKVFTNAAGGVLAAAGGTFFPDNLTNDGAINVSAGVLTLRGAWTSTGPFQVSGGTLNLADAWSNTGTFELTGGALNLGGSFTTADIDDFTNDGRGGVVNLTGTLDNAGSTLSLDDATGSLNLVGGAIVGGRVSTVGAAELLAGPQLSTLNGVTLAGTMSGFTVRATNGLTLEQGLIDVGLLRFDGAQTLGGDGEVVFTATPNNSLRVINGTLTVGPSITIRGATAFIGSDNSGRILNQGTIASDGGGTLTVQGIDNFVAGTLTGGVWQAVGNSTLRLIGAAMTTNAADILLDGANARLFSDAGPTNALAALAVNAAAGRLRLESGANLTTSAAAYTNAGTLTVGSGSTFTAGTLTVASGGNLNGAGTIAGNVVNNGVVSPGSSPGALRVNGSYTQGSAGTLNLDIGGTTPGSGYDQFRISGPANLNGAVDISLVDGFGPVAGQRFEVMTFASHNGTFSTVNGLTQGRFPLFSIAVNAANVELDALANGTDLIFDSFQNGTIPSNAAPGQNVSLTYTVKNLSEPAAIGDWIDSVYLSRDGVLDPSDALLTRVEHVGGVAGLGSYTATSTAPLPALADGAYRVIVVVDSRGLVSDADRANNTRVSTATITVTMPALVLGTPVMGTISPGQDLYYRLFLPPGKDVIVAADFGAAPGADVYLRYNDLPDRSNFDQASAGGDLGPRLLLANPSGGSHYVLIHGRDDAAGPIGFTLSAGVAGFKIVSFSPGQASNTWGSVQLELIGSEFSPQTTVTLKRTGGPERVAEIVEFVNDNLIRATFNLTGLPIGNYQVSAADAGSTAVADRTLPVDDAPLAGLEFAAVAPPEVRVGSQIEVVVFVTNQSGTVRRPLLILKATAVTDTSERVFRFKPLSFGESDFMILKYSPVPKANGVVSNFDFTFGEVPVPSEVSTDWESQRNDLRPDAIPADAWDAIWPSLKAQLGQTLADFLNLLDRDGTALAQLGVGVVEDNRIVEFELLKANGQMSVPVPAAAVDTAFPAPGLPLVFARSFASTIAGHYRLGRLGRGWVDNLDISISEDSTGQVTVRTGAGFRFFYRQGDGSYLAIPGDRGTLVKVNNAFQILEASGDATVFRGDGLFDYLEDANGNRLTAGYTGSQLTRLTHSNGSFLMLAYNAQGRLRQVTQANGDIANYDYDAAGEHLLRVTTTAGVTEYIYTTDATGPRKHALASITFPNNTHLFFQYNDRGWLAQQEADSGGGRLSFTYGPNSVSATNFDNQTSTVFYDQLLRPRQVQDPLGRIARMDFDSANDLASVSAAGAGQAGVGYDNLHNPTSTLNPLGERQAFTYDPAHNSLDVFTDALGHTTDFDYDPRGNTTSITYADGSFKQYGYDAQGNLTRSVSRLGQTITYTYNSSGQATRKDLPGGGSVDYTYNARGNLETAIDASGTTSLEYLDPQDPYLLTKVTHPSGRFLQYAYTNGRRTGMVDQSGFAVSYSYDAAGRPEFLRDGSNNLIVQYGYDAVGRLDRETRGNGTATGYAYFDDGRLRTITHYAPNALVQSQLAYTYDNLGRRRSVTTAEGTTSYDYDGAGRLTFVSLPGGRVIVYSYDAAGNRTTVTDSAASTTYTVNALNEYTAFGATTQTFDAGGNLVSSSGPGGSKSYGYDAEGRLVNQITPQGTWTYEYDVFGSRIASSLNGVRTQYLVDPTGNVVAEYDGNGNLQAHYVHGFGLTSRVDSTNASAYYQFDAVGSTTALTGSGGAVLNSYSYLPFGEALTASETVANPFEFVGAYGVMREGNGVDYMRNRWYAPEQGRFTQPDPIGLFGGANLYAYVGNDPVSLVDPSGLWPPSGGVFFPDRMADLGRPTADTFIHGEGSLSWEIAETAAHRAHLQGIRDAAHARAVADGARPFVNGGQAFGMAVRNPTVEINLAELAAQRAAAEASRSGGGGGAIAAVEIAKGVAAIGLGALAVVEAKEFADHGELPPGVFDVSTSKYLNDDALFDALIAFAYGSNPVGGIILAVKNLSKLFTTTKPVKQVAPSRDPNDIVGPGGFGPEQFIHPLGKLPYTINFQNVPDALGPAAEVVVTHVLDADLDLDTFELSDFGFGDVRVSVPTSRQFYQTRLDLRSTRGVFVDVTANLDRASRTVTWTLTAIDPATLDLPISPYVGFLPPDMVAPEGQGFVSFSVRTREGSPTGTRIDAQATIVFDTNAPIQTNIAVNTLDVGTPASTVSAFASSTQTGASFTVNWSGQDDAGGPTGSGIAGFDIYVSDNDGPFTLWKDDTSLISDTFTGIDGHSYGFYSVATDNVGHVEAVPVVPDAQTQVVTLPPGDIAADFDADGDSDGADFLIWQRNIGRTGSNLTKADGDADGDLRIDGRDLTIWKNAMGAPPRPWADFDQDNDVDGADFLIWQRNIGVLPAQASVAAGDANQDFKIDGEDLAHWQTAFAAQPPWADFDADNDVDGADFLTWQRNLGVSGVNATRSNGDANQDRIIDSRDRVIWEYAFDRVASRPTQVSTAVAVRAEEPPLHEEIQAFVVGPPTAEAREFAVDDLLSVNGTTANDLPRSLLSVPHDATGDQPIIRQVWTREPEWDAVTFNSLSVLDKRDRQVAQWHVRSKRPRPNDFNEDDADAAFAIFSTPWIKELAS